MTRPIVRERIEGRFKGKCAYCGGPGPFDIDHIIPLCRGGSDDEANRQPLCKPCHGKKGRGIDLKPYYKVGVSPDYVLLRQDFPIGSLKPHESRQAIIHMHAENDAIFGTQAKEDYDA